MAETPSGRIKMTENKDSPNIDGDLQKPPGEDLHQEKDDNFRTFFENMDDIIIVGSPTERYSIPTRLRR